MFDFGLKQDDLILICILLASVFLAASLFLYASLSLKKKNACADCILCVIYQLFRSPIWARAMCVTCGDTNTKLHG